MAKSTSPALLDTTVFAHWFCKRFGVSRSINVPMSFHQLLSKDSLKKKIWKIDVPVKKIYVSCPWVKKLCVDLMNTAWSWPKLTVAIKKIQYSKASLQCNTFFAAVNHTHVIPWNTETHKIDGNSPITNHKPWTFKLIVNFCFLRGPQRCLMAAKNENFTWLLNFKVCMVLKRALKHNIILRKHSVYHAAVPCNGL